MGVVGFVFFVNKKTPAGEEAKPPVFFLCRDTETGVVVGIISIHLEYWNNQTTLLRRRTYHQPEMMWHLARFHTGIFHLYVQMGRLRMCSS